MRKGLLLTLVFILLLAAPSAVRYWRFYDLNPVERTLPPDYDPTKIVDVVIPASTEFEDVPEMGEGLVLLDMAHQNSFTMEDIAYLDGRLAARGVELLPYEGGDLSLALRTVNAFVVIAPLSEYTLDEILAVTRFVDQGGRLLLIGDPTRFNVVFDEEDFFAPATIESDPIPLNSLSNAFDIVYNGDYLYNTLENEGNFRNIILRKDGFAEDGLVNGVQKLAFYGSHSLQVGPTGTALITGDEDTWSSATDRPGGLTLAAVSQEGRVVALGDIHFLTQPYYTVYDNGRFIAHLADFLSQTTGRSLRLADFPYFLNDEVNLIYTGSPELGPDAFDEIIALQDAFRRVDLTLSLAAEPADDADVMYLGLYNQVEGIGKILEDAGVELLIDPPITADDPVDGEAEENGDGETAVRLIQSALGNIQMSGTSLILLDEEAGQNRIIVLAASGQGLENSVNRLLNLIPLNADYALSDCLLQDNLALCPSSIIGEEVEAELDSSGAAETPEEGEVEPDPEDNGDFGGFDEGEDTGGVFDAIPQGAIDIDETVTGTLAENESHGWVFFTGPATIDIILSGEEMDGVLTVYGPDNEQLVSVDNGLTGEDEQIFALEIPDEDIYTIVVRDFFGSSVDYSLSVIPSVGVGQNMNFKQVTSLRYGFPRLN